MFKMIYKNFNSAMGRFLSLYLLLLVLAESVFAIRFLDFSEYDFGAAGGGKGLRLVDFDVDNQKFKAIHYYKYPAAPVLTVDYKGFKIELKGTREGVEVKVFCADAEIFENFAVSLPDKFDFDFPEEVRDQYHDLPRDGYKVFLEHIKSDWIAKGSDLKTFLNKYKDFKVKKEDLFQVGSYLYDSALRRWDHTPHPFSKISEDQQRNSHERGLLGELATILTMVSFGYRQYDSKHGSNNGFDGVFRGYSASSDLFLTESKNVEKPKSMIAYMNELSETTISRRLTHPGDATTKVKEVISRSPKKIFKLVQRVLRNGQIESLVKKFKMRKYELECPSPDEDSKAPTEEPIALARAGAGSGAVSRDSPETLEVTVANLMEGVRKTLGSTVTEEQLSSLERFFASQKGRLIA
jgi:hypothetical protein